MYADDTVLPSQSTKGSDKILTSVKTQSEYQKFIPEHPENKDPLH
jgi:hypothetical protein